MATPRKGQMFIVTMVFLIAMMLSVQELLLYFMPFDPSSPPLETDAYMLESIRDAFQGALDSSSDCPEARDNVEDLETHLARNIFSGFSVEVTGTIGCLGAAWPPSPELTIDITVSGKNSYTTTTIALTRS